MVAIIVIIILIGLRPWPAELSVHFHHVIEQDQHLCYFPVTTQNDKEKK
jgi:hypothetical protein